MSCAGRYDYISLRTSSSITLLFGHHEQYINSAISVILTNFMSSFCNGRYCDSQGSANLKVVGGK